MNKFIEQAKAWISENMVEFSMDLAVFLAIIIIGWFAIKIVLTVLQRMLTKASRVSEILEAFVLNVTHKVLWIILVMLALPRLGVDVAPLVASLGVGGFIIGFAFQETLGNLAAGLMLLLNQPFQKGDYVEAGGQIGEVQDMNIMCTTLATIDNKKVVVPNKCIWGNSIVNYTAHDTRRVDLTIGIAYGENIGKAREAILNAIKTESRVLADPAPEAEVVEMGDSSVNLVVRPWCKTDDYWDVFFSVNQKMKEGLDAANIEIPFPQMDVHHKNPATA